MRQTAFTAISSFHGTAFAINFNRQFLSVTPNAFSSRIDSILTLTGLQDRRINGSEDINDSMLKKEIDYIPVNVKLDSSRSKSLDYIREDVISI